MEKKKSLDSVKASKICYVYAILNTQTTVPETTYKQLDISCKQRE